MRVISEPRTVSTAAVGERRMTRLSSEARKEVALHEGAASARGVCRAPANARVGAFREEEGCVLGLQHQPLELGGAGEPSRQRDGSGRDTRGEREVEGLRQ